MRLYVCRIFGAAMAALLTFASTASAATVKGTVVDVLGGPIAGAKVDIRRDGHTVTATTTDNRGTFVVDGLVDGRYDVVVSADGFETNELAGVAVRGSAANVQARLQVGALRQDVSVTAAAAQMSAAQVGAAVTVLDRSQFDQLGATEVLEPLRGVPGVAVVQEGQRGGRAGLFMRGGAANFNKVLVDGMAINDIGGAFDLSNLATTGVGRVEVLRGANSVLYGADALAGVVDISTGQGRTPRPAGEASFDIGNLATKHTDLSVGGVATAIDYFGAYGHLDTDNRTPNSDFRSDTFSARLGGVAGRTLLSGTLRWVDSEVGSPNAFNHFAIADDGRSARTSTYGTLTARTQFNDRWQSTIRLGVANQDYSFLNPSPTGAPSDSSAFANYLGDVVTIRGANGYAVTGRAILDYSGTFPSLYLASNDRVQIWGQTGYQVTSSWHLAGGLRAEHESGTSKSDFNALEQGRNNYGGFAEGRGSLGGRVFLTVGLGVDRNAVFGTAATPRVSVAAYLRTPSQDRFSETKVTFNAGRGIKAPTIDQALQSVFQLIPESVRTSTGLRPVGPERSNTFDIGVEQGIAGGRARVRVAYFHNEFTDLLDYVSKSVLPQLGVPQAVINSLSFGAYANAQSNESQGLETLFELALRDLKVSASYTYLDAVVTASLSSGVLFPMENPAFPGIQIGQYAPLVEERPFRRPTNSGSVVATYVRDRFQLTMGGFFFGKADDSTYLSDAFFGGSMLLPNRNLLAAYQKFDLGTSYRFHRAIRWYLSAENAFNQSYQAAMGYPSLPRLVRTGVTLSFGGR